MPRRGPAKGPFHGHPWDGAATHYRLDPLSRSCIFLSTISYFRFHAATCRESPTRAHYPGCTLQAQIATKRSGRLSPRAP